MLNKVNSHNINTNLNVTTDVGKVNYVGEWN